MKTHAVIDTDTLIVLSYKYNDSKVHECQMFSRVWDGLPRNVKPKRILVDSAYHGETCLLAACQHGAVPLHGINKNARHFMKPEALNQKTASFWRHWPKRAATLYGKRNHAEAAFSMIRGRFGHRIRCR